MSYNIVVSAAAAVRVFAEKPVKLSETLRQIGEEIFPVESIAYVDTNGTTIVTGGVAFQLTAKTIKEADGVYQLVLEDGSKATLSRKCGLTISITEAGESEAASDDSDDEEEDEAPAPRGKKAPVAKKTAAKGKKAAAEEDADDEDDSDDSDDEDDFPVPAKKAAAKKPAAKGKKVAEDDEDEDDEPAPKAKKAAKGKSVSLDDDDFDLED